MGKHADLKRNKRINIPVTEVEHEKIKSVVPQTPYTSIAEFAREYLLMCVEVLENSNKQLVYFEVVPIEE